VKGLAHHGSGIMPIVLLIVAVLGGGYYLGRQWLRRRKAQNPMDSRRRRP
jgi:hypothetical protein